MLHNPVLRARCCMASAADAVRAQSTLFEAMHQSIDTAMYDTDSI